MKKAIAVCIACVMLFLLTGCWDYREIDSLSIVAGVGVDRDEATGNIILCIEITDLASSGQEPQPTSKVIISTGKTFFDAVRNVIAISGKKLYWSHAQILILGENLAKTGIIDVMDWFLHDPEPRYTVNVFVAKGNPVADFFNADSITNSIRSYEIHTKGNDEVYLSKSPNMEIYQMVNLLTADNAATYAPSITIQEMNGKKVSVLCGTAVFKSDKLVGYLDSEDTKYFLFAQDLVQGGMLVKKDIGNKKDAYISLEIYSNTTSIQPSYKDGKICVKIKTKTVVSIGENGTGADYMGETGRGILTMIMQNDLEQNILRVIKEVQNNFDTDIYGFGSDINNRMPRVWNSVKGNWDAEFKKIEPTVESEIEIINSGYSIKPIEGS